VFENNIVSCVGNKPKALGFAMSKPACDGHTLPSFVYRFVHMWGTVLMRATK
jgi:hypothetical protein